MADFGKAKLAQRSYFSGYLLWAAMHFAERARAIEVGHEGRRRFDPEHRACVLVSIQSSAGFLESVAAELFQDAADGHSTYLAPLSGTVINTLRTIWLSTEEGKKLTSLERYQLMLAASGLPLLDRAGPPYQAAHLLVGLRNAIVHYRSETTTVDQEHRLQKKLQGSFPENRLTSAGNAWWPDKCLGCGCAMWAHKSARALVDEVVIRRLDLSPSYVQFINSTGVPTQ